MKDRSNRRRAHTRTVLPTTAGTARESGEAPALEPRLACVFRRLGYSVHRRPATHDLGVDLSIARPTLHAIVQCKRWRHPVGPSVIRDLYGTLLHTGADLGILATTSCISRSARAFAQGKPLLLLDGAILRLLLPDSP